MGHCKCEMNANVRVESCQEANGFIKEYWKVILSLLMLIAGAIMNQLDVVFFRDNTISLVWYILAYLPVGLPVIKEAWESILQKDFFSESVCIYQRLSGIQRRAQYALCVFAKRTAGDRGRVYVAVSGRCLCRHSGI